MSAAMNKTTRITSRNRSPSATRHFPSELAKNSPNPFFATNILPKGTSQRNIFSSEPPTPHLSPELGPPSGGTGAESAVKRNARDTLRVTRAERALFRAGKMLQKGWLKVQVTNLKQRSLPIYFFWKKQQPRVLTKLNWRLFSYHGTHPFMKVPRHLQNLPKLCLAK